MNSVNAVITRVIDIRPYRRFWMVQIEVNARGHLTITEIFRDTEEQARNVQPGDVVSI